MEVSVILYQPDEVYQQLANAYEGLKHLIDPRTEEKERFYKSLRRLYFANVATYLCQYHDDTPLVKEELGAIGPGFMPKGQSQGRTEIEDLSEFLHAWASLRYNLITNDGEQYRAQDAYDCINELALFFSREVAANLTTVDR
jgi:hypothetical protein